MRTTKLTSVLLTLAALVGAQIGVAQQESDSTTPPSQEYFLSPPNQDGPVVVRAAFHLEDIDEINDEAETFEFTGILSLTWKDIRQAFDPEKAQVQEKIYQGEYQFNELSPAWYPQVVLANESGQFDKHAVLLRVKPDGTSTLIETINAVAEVKLNLRRYPFDSQRLEAIFEVLGFDTTEVVLETETLPVLTDSLQKLRMPQWILEEVSTSTRQRSSLYAGNNGTIAELVPLFPAEKLALCRKQRNQFSDGSFNGCAATINVHVATGHCTSGLDRRALLVGILDGSIVSGRPN